MHEPPEKDYQAEEDDDLGVLGEINTEPVAESRCFCHPISGKLNLSYTMKIVEGLVIWLPEATSQGGSRHDVSKAPSETI